MIPLLSKQESLPQEVTLFLTGLKASSFAGDIETNMAGRLVASTDNSIYQMVPQGVLYPRGSDDVQLLLELAREERFKGISFTPRGGGTGTNGQSLSTGLVVDLSRHMNQVLELNTDEAWVRVQPGVVLDQLNQQLKPSGYFFAPDLSPSNRATLGGMCNTDACGKGSRIYGKTSQHLLELELVLSEGSRWQSLPLTPQGLTEAQAEPGMVGAIHREVHRVVTEHGDEIEARFPQMTRYLSGYNLAHVYHQDYGFNLNYLIAGSEGTLAFVTELKLKLTPIPRCKRLVLAKYRSFDDSLRAARRLVAAEPAAIETVDDTIVGLARQDVIWAQVGRFFSSDDDHLVRSVNLIEFVGDDAAAVDAQVAGLTTQLEADLGLEGQAMGYELATHEGDINALWSLRKKGVGLLGNRPGLRRPVPFVEDTVVPPEHLADYISEFRAILDGHGLDYGMFGHVDAGCLHVRPALDLKTESDEELIRLISDQVKDLVLKYKGIIWGEHGKGLRGEYMPEFFGPVLYEELRKIKKAFDPGNRLNPGKLSTPHGSQQALIKLDEAPLRGHRDRQIDPAIRSEYDISINCNGNGACFNFHHDDVMCPSYKYSRDRVHSPKGRAGLMREWLRQLSGGGYDLSIADGHLGQLALGKGQDDFSVEVFHAMNGCLSCKACTSMCPVKVNIPELKAKFLHRFYTRYRRPWKDRLLAWGELIHQKFLPVPWLYNIGLKMPGFHGLMRRVFGLVDTPPLSQPSYPRRLGQEGVATLSFADLERWQQQDLSRTVFVLPDAITAFYEAETFVAAVKLLSRLGYRPVVTEFLGNGKGLHVKGFLPEFRKLARATQSSLEALAKLGRPILGLDPAITLTYREEYPAYLGGAKLSVGLFQEFLSGQLDQIKLPQLKEERPISLLGHCGEVTAVQQSGEHWQKVFRAFGLGLNLIKVGCCGMAGAFGHEAEHLDESRGIYELSWKPKLEEGSSKGILLATGASCRSQVKRLSGSRLEHPLAYLLGKLEAL